MGKNFYLTITPTKGNVWMMVTAQKSLDDFSQTILSETIIGKLKDRFPPRYRVSLHPSNITEVVQQRMLKKNQPTEKLLLEKLKEHAEESQILGNSIQNFKESHYKSMVALHPLGIQSIEFYFHLFDQIKLQSQDSASDSTSIRGLMQFLNGFYQEGFPSHIPCNMKITDYITADMVYDHLEKSLPDYVRNLVSLHIRKYKKICEEGQSSYSDHETTLPIRILKTIALINLAEHPCTVQKLTQSLHKSIESESIQIEIRKCLDNELFGMIYKRRKGLDEVYDLQPSVLGRIKRDIVNRIIESDDEKQIALELLVKCATEGILDKESNVIYSRNHTIYNVEYSVFIKADFGKITTSTITSPTSYRLPIELQKRHIPIMLLFAKNENPEGLRHRALELSKSSNNGNGVVVFMCINSRTTIDRFIKKHLESEGYIIAAQELLENFTLDVSDTLIVENFIKQQEDRQQEFFSQFECELTQMISSNDTFVAFQGERVKEPVPNAGSKVQMVQHLSAILKYCQHNIFHQFTEFDHQDWMFLLQKPNTTEIPERFQSIGIQALYLDQFNSTMTSFEQKLKTLTQGQNGKKDELEEILKKDKNNRYSFTKKENSTQLSVNVKRIYATFLAPPYGFSSILISTLISSLLISKKDDMYQYVLYSIESGVLTTYVRPQDLLRLFGKLHTSPNETFVDDKQLSKLFISTWKIKDLIHDDLTKPILKLFRELQKTPFSNPKMKGDLRLNSQDLQFTSLETDKMLQGIFTFINWLYDIEHFFKKQRNEPTFKPFSKLLYPPKDLLSLSENLQPFLVPPRSHQSIELIKTFSEQSVHVIGHIKNLWIIVSNYSYIIKLQKHKKLKKIVKTNERVTNFDSIKKELEEAQYSFNCDSTICDKWSELFLNTPWDIKDTLIESVIEHIEAIEIFSKQEHDKLDENITNAKKMCQDKINERWETHLLDNIVYKFESLLKETSSKLNAKCVRFFELKMLLQLIEEAPLRNKVEPKALLQLSHTDYKSREELLKHIENIETQCNELLQSESISTVTIK